MESPSSTMGDNQALQAEIARLKAENEKLKASNKRWMRIAGTEALTGLPNKVFFTTALLPQQISKANASGDFLGCLMIAPDGLGEINENYGRKGGDFIVKELAEFLKPMSSTTSDWFTSTVRTSSSCCLRPICSE